MLGSRTNAWAMLTPNGLSVRSRIRRISSFTASSSPEEVSMIPQAPARETAEASWLRAIQPIGAWMIGISTPRWRETRLSNAAGRVTWTSWSLLRELLDTSEEDVERRPVEAALGDDHVGVALARLDEL